MIKKTTGGLNDLEYLVFYNDVMAELEGGCVYTVIGDDITPIDFDTAEGVRELIRKCYRAGMKEGAKSAADANITYEEGRQVGYSLGYLEGQKAGKAIKTQNLLNAYGGR